MCIGLLLSALFPGPSFLSLSPHGTAYPHFRGEVTETGGGQAAYVALFIAGISTSETSNAREYK